ncbi:MAG TPA: S1C family serine protease [Rhodoglobus sp.]|nr:S1C family serine protease [Rhodoglobus sp.]
MTKLDRRRVIGASAFALALPLTLAGCLGQQGPQLPEGDGSVDLDGVQSATIQLEARGTFVEPGTLDPIATGGRGSGFIISPDGYAVTNNHVVVGAGTLDVWIGGDTKTTVGAEIISASECLDLAVVKLDGTDLPFMGWYEGDIKTTLDVYAAGFPLGDPNFTMTKGIVSKSDVPMETGWASLDHVIEHDARIRGGNSGGPLVAANGRVVGVNYAGNDELDYNFAIHRDQAIPTIEKMMNGETVLSLGVNAQALPPTEDGSPLGVWVSSVQAGSPADQAGILPGDLITQLGGTQLAQSGTLEEYCKVVGTHGSDGVIDVTVYRPGNDSFYEGQMNGDELEKVGGEDPVDPVDPVDPIGQFVEITNDAGTVRVTVPDTWSQVNGAPVEGNGIVYQALTASPDLASYQGSWSTPGVSISATQDGSIGIQQYLDGFVNGISPECGDVETGEYDDGLYAGQYAYFTGCGGTETDFLALAADHADGSHRLLLTVQMVSEQDKSVVLEQILGSFEAKF